MRRALLGLVALLGSTGCVCAVREPPPPPQPAYYCPQWVWIQGHYGPMGRWHPGHWRCAA